MLVSKQSARDRLAEAAFTLFAERGYEQTSIDDITERAGLGRTTFFRHYRSKEDVIFPDHDLLLAQIGERLRTSSDGTALLAVSDAVRLVLKHYVEEGDLARRRYALTSGVPALRDREIASVARYQRLFREFIAEWMGDPAEPAPLRAELMAAAVVAAHNHVLRRWLRGESPDPMAEVDLALRQVIELFATAGGDPATGADGTTIVAFRTGQDIEALLPALRRLADNVPSGST
jgi:AcrR family transcriptional regulator